MAETKQLPNGDWQATISCDKCEGKELFVEVSDHKETAVWKATVRHVGHLLQAHPDLLGD